MTDAPYFPVSLKLEGRPCLVIGNGREARLRAEALLDAQAHGAVESSGADAEPSPGRASSPSPLFSFETRRYQVDGPRRSVARRAHRS